MTASPPDVFVVDADPEAVARLRGGLAAAGLSLAGADASADGAVPTLAAMSPQVVILDASACADLALTVRKLRMACPESCIIVTGAVTPPATMSRAVASGARGFLLKPYAPQELFTTIAEALEISRVVAPVKVPRPAERSLGKLLAVYSPKGGVGCTTVATSLAVALAARPKTTVGLIDLDLQFGDVGALLDLHSVNSIAEMIRGGAIGHELIDETFVRHESGVRALLAPEDINTVDSIETAQVIQLLERLRAHFDFVVCDLWSSLDELTRGVMRLADRVLMVITPEFPALRDLQRVLKSVRADLHLDERMMVVVNRYPGKAGLTSADISKALGERISTTIPSEGITVTNAINRGISLLDSRARVRMARHFHELASLAADGARTEAGTSRREARIELSR